MFGFFSDRAVLFEEPALADYKKLDGKLDSHLALLMYQLCMQFSYYHELGHFIQYSPLNEECMVGVFEEIDEAYAIDIGEHSPYNLEKHLREFDADLHGSHYICIHMIDYWKRLNAADKTERSLELLLSLGVGAIFTYFIFLLKNYAAMYYDASDHPHTLIRILYIIDLFIQTAQKNIPADFKLSSDRLLHRAFQLTQAMFTFNGGEDLVKKFADHYYEEKEGIEDYINEVLIKESQKVPYLVLMRLKKMHREG